MSYLEDILKDNDLTTTEKQFLLKGELCPYITLSQYEDKLECEYPESKCIYLAGSLCDNHRRV